MGELVHEHEPRMALKYRVEVHLRNPHAPVFHLLPGNCLEAFYQRFGLRPAMSFDIADLYINPFVFPEVRCFQHLVGLANASDVSQENLEAAPVLLPLLALDVGEEGVRAGGILKGMAMGSASHSGQHQQHQWTPSSISSISMIFIPMNGAISPPTP